MTYYDKNERELADAATEQTGVGHDPRDHALWHFWRASKFYSAYEGMEAMLELERKQHQTEQRTKRIAILEFSKNVLDHLVEVELKEAHSELTRYFNAKEESHASIDAPSGPTDQAREGSPRVGGEG